MRPDGLTIVSGGAPSPAELSALSAALTALVEDKRATPVNPTPAVYRSRWRRAAQIESSEVPSHLKDDGIAWTGGL